ncbi:MAG: PAS domain-containing protein, partial [Candidatus Aminicenantes bacterium]|nr:PAS domain-containing protein [Candidatus Aminicenantes bacterium]
MRHHRSHELALLHQRVKELEISESTLRQLDEELKKSEYLKALILSSISELVIYQDTEQKIIWANKAAAESVGMTTDELAGRFCFKIWHGRKSPC